MKKFFAVLTAAFLTMGFVSCGDDEKDNPDNPNPPVADNVYRINNNGESWDAQAIRAIDYTDDDYITWFSYKTNTEGIYVWGYLESVVGTFDNEITGGDIMTYVDPDDLFQYQGQTFANCVPDEESFTETISAIDLTALTINATWSENYTDCQSYLDASEAGEDPVYNKTLSGELKNLSFELTVPQGKAATNKGAANTFKSVVK